MKDKGIVNSRILSDLKEYKELCRANEKRYKAAKRSNRRADRQGRKDFYNKYRMLKYPLMADVFDLVEGLRAEPNGRTPFGGSVRVERDIVYKCVDGGKLVMDIYFPDSPRFEKAPAVMDIPGGGWMIHNRSRRDGYARCFAALGVVVAVIEHRLCPEVFFPENLIDCIDAYNFLVENAEKYGIDENNITLTGDSSGGHLAACMGCASSNESYATDTGVPRLLSKPAGIIFISGAFSFDVMYRIPFTHTLMVRYVCGLPSRRAFRKWQYYKQINPYNYLTPDFPPSYNNGGATDFLCAGEAKRMADKLTLLKVENDYFVGKSPFNCMHCYVLRLPFKSARKDMLKIFEWYVKRQKTLGVDLNDGFLHVKRFLTNYKQVLKGKELC